MVLNTALQHRISCKCDSVIKTPHFVQMIQSIKFTSLFWHSREKTGSKED